MNHTIFGRILEERCLLNASLSPFHDDFLDYFAMLLLFAADARQPR